MKLLSVAVPCYNSSAYMRHCIDTLLPAGEDIEILIVDDGSQKDNTLEIAQEYEAQYPTIVRAIHQENAGHGGAVMTGLRNATGAYFKVVDSDDWVDTEVLLRLMQTLRMFVEAEMDVDLLISNYVYDKVGVEHKKVIHYRKALPENRVFTWDKVGRMPIGHYMLMHSVIYRTQLLLDCGLNLPTHTFYVDEIFVYHPIASVKRMYYINADFYHYFIGRNDQSVNEKVMMGRIDQQLRVNRIMVESVQLQDITNKNQQRYMFSYVEIITMICNVLLMKIGNEEAAQKREALWDFIQTTNPWLYDKLTHSLIGGLAHVKSGFGRAFVKGGYVIAQRLFGFN